MKHYLFIINILFFNLLVIAQHQLSISPFVSSNDKYFVNFSGEQSNLTNIAYGFSNVGLLSLYTPIPEGTPFTVLRLFGLEFPISMCKGENETYYVTVLHTPPIPPMPAKLYQFDQSTGAFNLLGSINGMGEEEPLGIAYNTVDSLYYIVSASNLYLFDISSRIASLIGPFNTGGMMIDLSINCDGICYGYDIETDNSYIIDLESGNAALLGPLGFDANYGQGMSIDHSTGIIYLSVVNNSSLTGQLRTLDPVTGGTTLLVDWGFEQISAFAIESSCSPPCTVGAATNPVPSNGATNIPISENILTWNNSSGTDQVKVYFGEIGNLELFYDGQTIDSVELPLLNYSQTYVWRVLCRNEECGTLSLVWSFTTMDNPNQVEFEDETPIRFLIQQNYPNPFNPTTKIKYQIPEISFVTIKVYDVLGNEVVTLVNEEKPAGSYEIEFQSTMGSRQLASGIYYYQLMAGHYVETKKMILLK